MLIDNETDARAYGLAMAMAFHIFAQNRSSRCPLPAKSDWLDREQFSENGIRYYGHARCVFDGELESTDEFWAR